MNLHFALQYRTAWGQRLDVELTLCKHREITTVASFPMETDDGVHWHADVKMSAKDLVSFAYQYVVRAGDETLRREWNLVERRYPAADLDFHFPDYWRDIPRLSHLYSAAYAGCVTHFVPQPAQFVYFQQTLIFRVMAPQLKKGQRLAIIGSQPPLGAWDVHRYLPMQPAGINEWVISLSASGLYLPFEYKYVVVDDATGELTAWEGGENRLSPSGVLQSGSVVAICDQEARLEADRWKAAGVVVPLFSLRTANSQGVGDFTDLRMMADWAHSTGLSVVQLLPIYDTIQTHTWTDCYPYSSISIYALHPMYVDLQRLPPVNDAAFMLEYEKQRRTLNALPKVDYEGVNKLKSDYLHRIFDQQWRYLQHDEEYDRFCHENEWWITRYAAFCLLRDRYRTCDFRRWPRYSEFQEETIQHLAEKHRKDIHYYIYVQYLLDKQLSEATAYARSLGVVLKGDLPIGISRYSVEAWTMPEYFHLDSQAGAPPDAFSADGQNWGFPTYNWARMAKDGYQWWKDRMQRMARYFDAYRIDHVLGFFRIWEIPQDCVNALLGHFSPALPLTEEEIGQYGFPFDASVHAQPYITDEVLYRLFGTHAEEVTATYLLEHGGSYRLKPEYDTQRKVEAAFAGCADDLSLMVRDGLYRLIGNVLFVADPYDSTRFHPRINALDTYAYKALPAVQREAFGRLHEDYFYHRHDDFWREEAMKKLPALVATTNMLVCAEDLGMVPSCVAPVMSELRMLSLEIQAMPKAMGMEFGKLEENPYLSVSTLFTHDMPTLREWWEQDAVRAQSYYNHVLLHDGKAPQVLPGWLAEEIVARHIYCPSMLCLVSLQDWLSIDETLRYPHPAEERINIPAIAQHYWRYRMHLNIEDLLKADSFNARVAELVRRGDRKGM